MAAGASCVTAICRSPLRQIAQRREFIEEIDHRRGQRGRGLAGRRCFDSGHVLQALRDHQAQPARIGGEAIGRQDEKDGRNARFQIPEGEIRATKNGGHAR